MTPTPPAKPELPHPGLAAPVPTTTSGPVVFSLDPLYDRCRHCGTQLVQIPRWDLWKPGSWSWISCPYRRWWNSWSHDRFSDYEYAFIHFYRRPIPPKS